MAVALVNAASVYDGSTRAITKAVTSGNFLLFFYQYSGLNNCGVPTDTQSNTWTMVAERAGDFAADVYVHIYWTRATATGNLTVTGAIPTGTPTDYGESLHEYTGVDTGASPLDITATAIAAGAGDSGPAQVALNSVAANALIVAIAGDESGGVSYTALADYTRETYESTHVHATLDRILGSAGNYTPGFTLSGTIGWVIAAASIKEAAAASGAIASTTAATGAQTGDLKGAGALLSTNAATGAQTATLLGAGALAATNAATGAQTADLSGLASALSTTAATSAQTATLLGAGALAGTNAATAAQTGTLLGAGALAATSAATAAQTADLTSLSADALAALVNAITTLSGTLLGAGELAAIIAATTTQTGSLTDLAASAEAPGMLPPWRPTPPRRRSSPPLKRGGPGGGIDDEELAVIYA